MVRLENENEYTLRGCLKFSNLIKKNAKNVPKSSNFDCL